MEQQLASYRKRKAKEHSQNLSWSQSSAHFFNTLFRRNQNSISTIKEDDISDNSDKSTDSPELVISDSGEIIHKNGQLITIQRVLKVVLWFVLWAIFLELHFGAVYFAVSLLFILYWTTKTGPKSSKNLSAYSVFNPNCERIDGTFTAEQFEKELRFGAGSVH